MAGSVNTAARRPQSVNIAGINNTARNTSKVPHSRVGSTNNTGGGSSALAVAFLSRCADKPQIRF